MSKKQIMAIGVLILLFVTASSRFSGWVSAYSPDFYHQIQKNIELFGRVYQEISRKYVEEVDPNEFMRAGIDGMLSTLDPYTVLVEKEDNAELQIMSSGKYGGLGMRIGLRNGWPTVVDPPFNGTPSLKAGIREGDQIIHVDSIATKGKTISAVANLLRGEIGSEVFLRIAREGEDGPIEFRLIRAEIVVTDVAYSGMIQDNIGFIRLSHFSRNAGKDIENAIRKLKKQGLEALILDLRQNPGGLLEAAVNVGENFIAKGKLIVSTEGRASGAAQKYKSEKSPILGDLPLVVLVNGLSASASEIVAGAVQDQDRGVIIGSKTFGKGLVQTVVPITGDAALKITTAKYLLPSGRSIQDPSKFIKEPAGILLTGDGSPNGEPGEESEGHESQDDPARAKQQKVFRTANGREVEASHGVIPDIAVEQKRLTAFEIELLRKTMPFQFSVIYAARHPELNKGFEVTPEMIREFEAFLKEQAFEYTSEAEVAANKIAEIATKRDYLADISPSLEQMKRILLDQKVKEFQNSQEFIKEELEEEISAKLWGTQAEVEAGIDSDLGIQKALEVLTDREKYQAILRGGLRNSDAK